MVAGFGSSFKNCSRIVPLVSPESNWFEQEAITSAINPETWDSNISWVEGDEAIAILAEAAIAKVQRVSSYVTRPAQKLLDRYEFAREGGWVAYGCTIDGESAEVAYFKPISPRLDFEKRKKIKYETPAGMPAQPLLPWVFWRQGLRIAERYGVGDQYRDRMEQENRRRKEASLGFKPATATDDTAIPDGIDRGFYRWVISHPEIPVLVVEGWKKALSLLDHGQVAIALRGVTCWHEKGGNELHEVLGHFAIPGRQIRICFDQDTKASTIKNVGWEIKKLGRAFEAEGCNVLVIVWAPKLGKGVDDVIFGQGEAAQQWLETTIATAPTFEEWSKAKHKEYLLRVWRYLESLGIDPERSTEGQYLPELSELEQGAIHVVTAPTGSGKTTALKRWVKLGYLVVVLSPLNSLGKQTAEAWGLPHRHDCSNDQNQQAAFRLLVYDANGVVCCVDSLARIQEFIGEDTPLLLMLDECNQALESLNTGGTLKMRQAEILELFAKALKIAARNGAIVLSEARVNRRSLEFVQSLSGCDRVRLIEHRAQRQSWDIQLAQGDQSGFVRQMIGDLRSGNKIICHVTGRNAGRKLEKLIAKVLPGKRVIRIDSETKESGAFDAFEREPDQWLRSLPEWPDLLIASPSLKSGISITEPGFDRVYGLFTCHYPSMWAQMLARYRLPVPRRIYCPRFIPAGSAYEGYCSSREVKRQLKSDLEGYRRLFGIAAALEQAPELAVIQEAHEAFYADHVTSIGIEKAHPVEVLTQLLQDEGHNTEDIIVKISLDRELKKQLKEIQREVWMEDAAVIAAANPEDMTIEEARDLLNSSELTTVRQWQAHKVLWRNEFPGVIFDDVETCFEALTENFGSLRRGVLLQAAAMNLDRCKAAETELVRAVLEAPIPLSHRLPRKFIKAKIIDQVGLLAILDGTPYKESDHRIQNIKTAALRWKREIYKFFTLNIKPDQTGIEIVNKLLRKLALKAEVLRKVGPAGRQVKIWGLPDLNNPTRIELLKAVGVEHTRRFEPKPPQWADQMEAINDARIKAQKLDRADIQGAIALLKQISQYPGQWQATVWTLIKNLPGGWAINRAVRQYPDLAIEFGPLAAQSAPVLISEAQAQEVAS